MKFFRGFDFLIFSSSFVLITLGLLMIWSLSPSLFPQQLTFFLFGLVIFFIFSRLDFRIFDNLSWILYFCSLGFLLFAFLFGQASRGSVRWIQVGNFTLQPSEIVKPFLICFFASIFSRQEKISILWFLKILLFLSPPLFFIFRQPDLGSTLIILVSFLGIFLASNIPLVVIFSGLLFLSLISPVIWFFLRDYQKSRIVGFLNPYLDPSGMGYHLIQSMITVGSGGIFGRGLGAGTQSHLAFLPERHTDFIFASLSEELGFLGGGLTMFCYFLILFRILRIAQRSSSDFGRLLAVGIFSLLSFQIFVNIGMNMGILPITGITLPLFSYGGSSIISTMICLGMVESIARFKKPEEMIEIR